MKKTFIYLFSSLFLLGITTGCNDFGNINDDPEHITPPTMKYEYMFTQVQTQIAGSDWDVWRNGCIYSMNMLQHTTSVTNWSQGVFYTWTADYNAAYWDGFYSGGRGAIRNIIEVVEKWKDNPNYKNEYQYSRVMKAYLFQRMTDLYGDVPYFDAGNGLDGSAKYSYPKYDTQEAIYDDLLKELDEVNTALKGSTEENNLKGADIIFKGDSEKWRKFANSLMLRIAMRLTKVDPEKAATWSKKALANGLFDNLADNAMIVRESAQVSNDSAEPYGKILSESDPAVFFLSEFFVNELKAKNDPRLQMIATRCDNPETSWSSGNSFDYGSNADKNKLIGMPIGYRVSGEWSIYDMPGFDEIIPDSLFKKYYALPNRKTYSRPDAPSMLVTYTENNLLLADAAVRGFIPGGTAVARDYFKKGVEAAMNQFTYYPAAKSDYELYLNQTAISAYINSRLTAFDANPLKEINWEYYVTTFCDEYETFANWRRSGYPELKSVYSAPYSRPLYPNRVTDEIPRRFTYPSSESQYNQKNYNEAVGRLNGGDAMSSRIWWDK